MIHLSFRAGGRLLLTALGVVTMAAGCADAGDHSDRLAQPTPQPTIKVTVSTNSSAPPPSLLTAPAPTTVAGARHGPTRVTVTGATSVTSQQPTRHTRRTTSRRVQAVVASDLSVLWRKIPVLLKMLTLADGDEISRGLAKSLSLDFKGHRSPDRL